METKEKSKLQDNVLPKKVFEYLQKECPEFLHSYAVLSSFYTTMTDKYDHKKWKDGRIVLTPKKS